MTNDTILRCWQPLSRQKLYEDPPWLEISVETVRLPNGKTIDRFYQIGLPEYAMIAAVTRDGRLVLERQYRHALGRVAVNLPGGFIEKEEEPLSCAKRELMEETGFQASDWRYLGSFCVDGNRGCGRMHALAAVGAELVRSPQPSDVEESEVFLATPRDALQYLLTGQIGTSGPALALAITFLSPLSPLAIVGKVNPSEEW